MAFDAGSVIAHIKADITDFQKGINSAKETTNGLGSTISKVGEGIANFGKQAAVFSTIASIPLTLFFKDASQEAANFEKALITLDIIAGRFGESGKEAQDAAKELGSTLRIGVSSAAESLQNLLKSGLNLDQARDLLKRFTNEAMTGKSPTLSLAQAVQNLSFAYATNNSAIGNLSGISENFVDVTKRGRDALLAEGMAASEITDDMAKYRGTIDLTNLTMGSAERFAGSFIDRQAQLQQKIIEVKVALGQALNPVLAEFIGLITDSGILEGIASFAQDIGPKLVATFQHFGDWVKENKDIIIPFLKGLAIGLTALFVIGQITALIAALTNPLTLLVLGIALLYTAWETNFLGMKDVTTAVVTQIVGFWNDYLHPAIERVVGWFQENWDHISNILNGAWLIIKGIVEVGWAIVSGIIRVGLAILSGNWGAAWQAIKDMVSLAWDGIKNIFNGIIDFLKGWGGLLIERLTKPFSDAWDRVREFVDNIKNALDFTKRQSPSVMDILNKSIRDATSALSRFNFDIGLSPKAAALAVNNAGDTSNVNRVIVDMNGAIVSNAAAAAEMGEIIGDSIIKKLQMNVRL